MVGRRALLASGLSAPWLRSASATEPVRPGPLRIAGADLRGLVRAWEQDYAAIQQGVRFADTFGGSDAAFGALVQATADIVVMGREPDVNDYLGFYETYGHYPLEVTVASGTYDVPGGSWAPVVFVSGRNPLTRLTLPQLDGIFGAERTGAYDRFTWMPKRGRSASANIRTWDQLGLGGQWEGREIQTYGYAGGGMAHFFELQVLQGGTKWNPNYRQYVENGTKILTEEAKASGILTMLAELEQDPFGMGWAGIPQFDQVRHLDIRPLALAASPAGPYVQPTRETMLDRSYPLTRSIYAVVNKLPGQPLAPPVADFLRYVLSARGQLQVAGNGVYLPLPASVAAAQQALLSGANPSGR